MHSADGLTRAATVVDIIVVGGGLAGTTAATILGRQGFSVALLDTHAVYPTEFRAEKLGDPHVALLDRLALTDTALGASTRVDRIDVYRFGRRVARENRPEYGFAYSDLVNAFRTTLPGSVEMAIGRVATMTVGDDRQTVQLSDGRAYTGRLLVIATGLGDAIRRAVGIERVEARRTVSLSLGFDLAGPASSYPFQALTAFGHRRADRLSYLTLFPIGDVARANLFVYREAGEAWTKEFRRAPQAMLQRLLPELDELCRGFAVEGRVDVRPIDLITTRNHRRSGVALIGDAFQTTCPIPGYGILRVLTDVERLCTVHVPRWFTTPGMNTAKIGQYYDDPAKREMDARATRASLYARSIVVDDGLIWTARRLRNAVVRRGLSQAFRLFRPLRGLGDDAMTSALGPSRR